jgi:hypothetical protein
MTPLDLLLVALAFLGLALTLAARTWVRLNEPELLARRRGSSSLETLGDVRGSARSHERVPPVRAPGPAASSGPGAASTVSDAGGHWQRLR